MHRHRASDTVPDTTAVQVLRVVFIGVSESLQEVSESDKVVECQSMDTADGGPRDISEASSRHL